MADPIRGIVDRDFLRLYRQDGDGKKKHAATLAFGDVLLVGATEGGWTEVQAPELFDGRQHWFVRGRPKLRPAGAPGVLRMTMVDVQQGDGLVFDTPAGKTLLVDGGDNKLFARHLAARYQHRKSSAAQPLEVDAILVTHGDADHFDGLSEIKRSETLTGDKQRKRLFIHPRRVYHNGLVKRPTKLAGKALIDAEQFGASFVDARGQTWATALEDDPRNVEAEQRNQFFDTWASTLDHWQTRGPIDVRRIDADSDASQLFDFLEAEGIRVELLGPIVERVATPAGEVPALRFFSAEQPEELSLEHGAREPGRPSASHTINGHSIALRLGYGNVRFLLTGDLNRPALERLVEHIESQPERGTLEERLGAEIVKAPHHGSHEFALSALKATRPVVALVSSGDESEFKEYIHPRATLMSALGQVMRGDQGVVLCTELAAFFAYRKLAHGREKLKEFFEQHAQQSFSRAELVSLFRGETPGKDGPPAFESFERTNFGIIHVRTDGERVLVFTHSGQRGLNEAYRFRVDAQHRVTFEDLDTQ